MQRTFKVPDVSCGHCKAAIEGALEPIQGVSSTSVDIEAKTVTVEYDDSSVDAGRITGAIEDAGYPIAS